MGMAVVAAVALLRGGPPAPEVVGPNSVIGLAEVSYTEHGSGKCLTESGEDPKAKWYGSGNIKLMCDARKDCLGYSMPSSQAGGLLWLSGPLKGGGDYWGNCKCFIKGEPEVSEPPEEDPPVEETDEPLQKEFVSRYYIKNGMCPKDEMLSDYSECVNNFAMLRPEKISAHNRKYSGSIEGGCLLNKPVGVWFNTNMEATWAPRGTEFVCKKKEEDMPDFDAMRKDNMKMMWHCLRKAGNYGRYRDCMIQISEGA